MGSFDFIVIGGGIAGASAGAELARHGSVVLLEGEEQPGYHSTGRSAAFFTENYGGPAFRRLTRASKAFFLNPPDGFTDVPLLRPGSGSMFIAKEDQRHLLDEIAATTAAVGGHLRPVEGDELYRLCPVLRDGVIVAGLHETEDREMEVAALHQGYLSTLKRRGGQVMTAAPATAITRTATGWRVTTPEGDVTGAVLINAGGAWGDVVAEMAGIRPIGLTPLRRSAITFAPPPGVDPSPWPMCISAAEEFYFKPDAGVILGSPANEDPMGPCDVQPEDLDIAYCVHHIEECTTLTVGRILSKWAGLRSFTPDRGPGVGPDTGDPSFVWCVGQGGYGIQSSPAMGRLTAALAIGAGLPDDLAEAGLTLPMVTIDRFR